LFISFLPPGVGSKGDIVVHSLVRCIAIVGSIRVDTAVGTTDNTVVAAINVGGVVAIIPWQRQRR